MSKKVLITMIGFALVAIGGLVFSGLLLHQSLLISAGVEGPKTCHLAEGLSCDPALKSAYATLLGVPLPVLSAGFYLHILALLIGLRMSKVEEKDQLTLTMRRYLFAVFAMAAAFSAFLAYVIFFLLPMTCPFCIGIHVVNFSGLGLALYSGPKVKEGFGEFGAVFGRVLKASPFQSGIILLVVATALGSFSYHYGADWLQARNKEAQRAEGKKAAQELTLEGDFQIDLTGLPRKGPADAPITLVEFSDFECPFCVRFAYTARKIHEAYPDEVKIYFVHYPLDGKCNPGMSEMHPSACLAARGAVCAQDQGEFWKFHDHLFSLFELGREQGVRVVLNNENLHTIASDLDLNVEKFDACMKNPSSKERVSDQIKLGLSNGMKSVPSWALNGHLNSGAHTFEYVQPLIDRLLELHEEEGKK